MQKKSRLFSRNNILILIIVIGLIAVIGWLFINQQNNSTDNNSGMNKSSNMDDKDRSSSRSLMPEDITEKIKSNYASMYKLVNLDENNNPKSGEISVRLDQSAPAYKTDGYNYYTDSDGGSTLTLMAGPLDWASGSIPRPIDTEIRTEVAKVYVDFGLAKTTTYGSIESGNGYDVYTGQGLICTIEEPLGETSSTSASCGRISNYKANAEKIKPFAEAIPNVTPGAVLMGLQINNSSVSGYQNASINMGDIESGGGSVAFLYKKGNGPWLYFMNAQDIRPCSAYNTTDIKNAFRGENCDAGNGQIETVK